jgi:MoaA/NifB/PqqE/SkfB family radical SAM enzyme
MAPPRFLFLDINRRCNLRCQHCMYWKSDDSDLPGRISAARRIEILSEFAELSPGGSVVICGGESMLDEDDYFDVASSCRARGLRCLSVINGTRVTNEELGRAW